MEKQPIGHRLFYDFCGNQIDLKNCIEFLNLVNKFDLSIEEKHSIAQQIRDEFLQPVGNGTTGHKKRLTVRINNQQNSRNLSILTRRAYFNP